MMITNANSTNGCSFINKSKFNLFIQDKIGWARDIYALKKPKLVLRVFFIL